MPLRVRFRHFWSEFVPHEFFVPLLARVSSRAVAVVTDPSADVDLELDSVLDTDPPAPRRRLPLRSRRRGSARLRLWYTGENIRPPAHGYDATLGFDLDDRGGTNSYLPLPFLGLDWFGTELPMDVGEARRIRARPTPAELARPRHVADDERPLFACAFVGRPDSSRLRAIESLRRIGDVDVFGPAVGRPVDSKTDTARSYRFMVCFENSVHPGYVTEKAVEAWWSGCVPIWRGVDAAGLLNPSALLNRQDFGDLDDFVAELAHVDADPQRFRAMREQPIAAHEWRLDAVEELLARMLRRRGITS